MVVMMSEARRMHLHSPEAFVAARNLGAPPPPRTRNLGITGGIEYYCNSSWCRVISTTLPKGTVFDPVQDRMLDYMNVHNIT
jgi:hypothetical protein